MWTRVSEYHFECISLHHIAAQKLSASSSPSAAAHQQSSAIDKSSNKYIRKLRGFHNNHHYHSQLPAHISSSASNGDQMQVWPRDVFVRFDPSLPRYSDKGAGKREERRTNGFGDRFVGVPDRSETKGGWGRKDGSVIEREEEHHLKGMRCHFSWL